MCLFNFSLNYARHFLCLAEKRPRKIPLWDMFHSFLVTLIWLLNVTGHPLGFSITIFVCVWQNKMRHEELDLRMCVAGYLEWMQERAIRLGWLSIWWPVWWQRAVSVDHCQSRGWVQSKKHTTFSHLHKERKKGMCQEGGELLQS